MNKGFFWLRTCMESFRLSNRSSYSLCGSRISKQGRLLLRVAFMKGRSVFLKTNVPLGNTSKFWECCPACSGIRWSFFLVFLLVLLESEETLLCFVFVTALIIYNSLTLVWIDIDISRRILMFKDRNLYTMSLKNVNY